MGLFGVSPETFHDHSEAPICHDDHVHESVDSCHWSIHHGVEKCSDHDHISEDHHECDLCDLTIVSTWLDHSVYREGLTNYFSNSVLDFCSERGFNSEFDASYKKRGPPSTSNSTV